MATVFTRVWIGSILIVAIVGLLTIDKLSGHGYGAIALVMALGSAGLVEFARMVHPRPVASAGLVLAGAGYLALLGLGYELEPRLHLLLAPWAVLTLYALFFWQLRGAPSAVRFEGLGLTVLGFVYMAFLSGFTLELRFLGRSLDFRGASLRGTVIADGRRHDQRVGVREVGAQRLPHGAAHRDGAAHVHALGAIGRG